uniref:Uncharacterized protein n=1 Tax=Anguilla anguilla TaxID=7936 RepID=A0A0E9X826_ANGAN
MHIFVAHDQFGCVKSNENAYNYSTVFLLQNSRISQKPLLTIFQAAYF